MHPCGIVACKVPEVSSCLKLSSDRGELGHHKLRGAEAELKVERHDRVFDVQVLAV